MSTLEQTSVCICKRRRPPDPPRARIFRFTEPGGSAKLLDHTTDKRLIPMVESTAPAIASRAPRKSGQGSATFRDAPMLFPREREAAEVLSSQCPYTTRETLH
jgi:hypothetical protein